MVCDVVGAKECVETVCASHFVFQFIRTDLTVLQCNFCHEFGAFYCNESFTGSAKQHRGQRDFVVRSQGTFTFVPRLLEFFLIAKKTFLGIILCLPKL